MGETVNLSITNTNFSTGGAVQPPAVPNSEAVRQPRPFFPGINTRRPPTIPTGPAVQRPAVPTGGAVRRPRPFFSRRPPTWGQRPPAARNSNRWGGTAARRSDRWGGTATPAVFLETSSNVGPTPAGRPQYQPVGQYSGPPFRPVGRYGGPGRFSRDILQRGASVLQHQSSTLNHHDRLHHRHHSPHPHPERHPRHRQRQPTRQALSSGIISIMISSILVVVTSFCLLWLPTTSRTT